MLLAVPVTASIDKPKPRLHTFSMTKQAGKEAVYRLVEDFEQNEHQYMPKDFNGRALPEFGRQVFL